jgi:hypothetical protein
LGEERRAETTACERLCLYTCLSQKTLKDKVKMGLTLLTGNRGKKNGSRKVVHTRATAKAAAGNGKGRAVELPILR